MNPVSFERKLPALGVKSDRLPETTVEGEPNSAGGTIAFSLAGGTVRTSIARAIAIAGWGKALIPTPRPQDDAPTLRERERSCRARS